MSRLLIVPAAGLGTRLGAAGPKLLVPVNGRPMIDHLFALHRAWVDGVALVVHPSARGAVSRFVARAPLPVELFVQEQPTGMLDAILIARPAVERSRPARVWVTWCDQIAIRRETLERLASASGTEPAPDLVLPTCPAAHPYIHFDRDARGDIVGVRQRREGDEMPETGESDTGLFDLSREAYLRLLPVFAAEAQPAAGTAERNFLPFIPWLASRGVVATIPCSEPAERIGINTPEDLTLIAGVLRERERGG